jgi:hypothetical protein
MPAAKGTIPPNAGKGRPKGSKNKSTALLKDAILQAADQAGGQLGLVGYLQSQATENPAAFMSLLGKVLPMQVTGADGDALIPTTINIVAPKDGS